MARFSIKYRAFASVGFFLLVLFWFTGVPTGEVLNISMDVISPRSGEVVPMNTLVGLELEFRGGEVDEVKCGDGGSVNVQKNHASLKVQAPGRKGLWVLRCEAISATGSLHVFKPAYLVGSEKVQGQDGMPLGQEEGGMGALVLPQAFFRPGCSNFLPIMEESLNTHVIPQIEAAFGSGRRILVDRKYLGMFKALVNFWDFKVGPVTLEMGTEGPNGLVVEAAMNDLSAEGHARFEIVPLSKLPVWARKITDLNFEGRLSGQGKIRAVFDLLVDEAGQIRSALRPESFEARFHHFCFDTLCFEVESNAGIQSTITRKMRPMFGARTTQQLDLALNQAMARASLRVPIFDEVERAELRPRGFSILKNGALAFSWDVSFEKDDQVTSPTLTWSGSLPLWQSPRPHILISDRLFNQILVRIWSKKLRAGLPGDWVDSINMGLRSTGYQVVDMRLEAPPVLAPGFGADGLRLILSDVRVRLRAPGAPIRQLRVHAELPVRLIPSADHSKIVLVGAYHADDLQDVGADLIRDDGVVHVECLEEQGIAGSESCSADTRRFQRLVDVALSMAQGLRTQIKIPLVGPRVPGPGGKKQNLQFSRIQLVPGAPGWLILEVEY
jgi:hypothetical protein